jgi:prepilin-type N-terminal cleavage/methylation domain-containing protein
VKTEPSARTLPAPVAADGRRRHFRCGKNAPTAVGGYSRFTLRAFTLIELLTVIAIMGIMAAITLPSLRSLKPNPKVAGTRQLLDAVGRARQLALSQRTTVYMIFVSTNFWTDPAATSWNANDTAQAANLYDKQLVGYAYACLRSVGDQPGAHTARYLSSWKTLPQGAFIDPRKFIPSGNVWPPNGLILTNTTLNPGGNLPIFPFSRTNSIPFPAETNQPGPYIYLPYIAFDGTGQLVSGPPGQPELIPISEGSVGIARDPNTKVAQQQPAQPNEMPLGNTVENYSLVYIDRLTGRAHVERRIVQ